MAQVQFSDLADPDAGRGSSTLGSEDGSDDGRRSRRSTANPDTTSDWMSDASGEEGRESAPRISEAVETGELVRYMLDEGLLEVPDLDDREIFGMRAAQTLLACQVLSRKPVIDLMKIGLETCLRWQPPLIWQVLSRKPVIDLMKIGLEHEVDWEQVWNTIFRCSRCGTEVDWEQVWNVLTPSRAFSRLLPPSHAFPRLLTQGAIFLLCELVTNPSLVQTLGDLSESPVNVEVKRAFKQPLDVILGVVQLARRESPSIALAREKKSLSAVEGLTLRAAEAFWAKAAEEFKGVSQEQEVVFAPSLSPARLDENPFHS